MKMRYLFIFLLLVVGGYVAFRYIEKEPAISVTAAQVERGLVEVSVANTRAGTVKARHRAGLAPAIGGQIATLDVEAGDQVKTGQILLTLWNRDIHAQVELARRESAVSAQQTREVCLLAELAARDAERLSGLYEKKSVAEGKLDDAKTTALARQSACQTARLQEKVSSARVAVYTAQLEKTILQAPFAGIVAEVHGEIGEFVTPSPTGVATLPAIDLISLDEVYVAAPIDEMDAALIRPEMEVRITLDAFPGKVFPGRVMRIAPYVLEQAKQARTVEVECGFSSQKDMPDLLAGYSADVEIILAVGRDVLRVPTEAVLDAAAVYVYQQQSGRVERRSIEIGQANWRYTEIISGLEPEEWVVTSLGRQGLQDGVRATIEDDIFSE